MDVLFFGSYLAKRVINFKTLACCKNYFLNNKWHRIPQNGTYATVNRCFHAKGWFESKIHTPISSIRFNFDINFYQFPINFLYETR